jgi:hypothetical protein
MTAVYLERPILYFDALVRSSTFGDVFGIRTYAVENVVVSRHESATGTRSSGATFSEIGGISERFAGWVGKYS